MKTALLKKRTSGKSIHNLWYAASAIAFFALPVAVPFLAAATVLEWKRKRDHNEAPLRCAILLVVVSIWMLSALYFMATGMGYASDGDFMRTMTFYYLQGIAAAAYELIIYCLLQARDRAIERCLYLILHEHFTSIPKIAEFSGMREKKTVAAIRSAVRFGLLEDAQADIQKGEIVFRKCCWARQRVVCVSCGAELVVNLGETLVCPYCGSALRPENRRRGA